MYFNALNALPHIKIVIQQIPVGFSVYLFYA